MAQRCGRSTPQPARGKAHGCLAAPSPTAHGGSNFAPIVAVLAPCWEHVRAVLRVPPGDPERVYTTNAIESLNMQLRKSSRPGATSPTMRPPSSCCGWRCATSPREWNSGLQTSGTTAMNHFAILYRRALRGSSTRPTPSSRCTSGCARSSSPAAISRPTRTPHPPPAIACSAVYDLEISAKPQYFEFHSHRSGNTARHRRQSTTAGTSLRKPRILS